MDIDKTEIKEILFVSFSKQYLFPLCDSVPLRETFRFLSALSSASGLLQRDSNCKLLLAVQRPTPASNVL
jgi:hypothetical protein